jgi:hypothetical protein
MYKGLAFLSEMSIAGPDFAALFSSEKNIPKMCQNFTTPRSPLFISADSTLQIENSTSSEAFPGLPEFSSDNLPKFGKTFQITIKLTKWQNYTKCP